MASDIHPMVLVIEDDESVTRMLRFSLRSAGFDTTEVATGGEALHILKQQPPDAAVLDLHLPNGQGGAVLDWLRQLDERTGANAVADLAFVVWEVARHYRDLELAEDGFFRLAFQEELKRSPHKLLWSAQLAGQPVVGVAGHSDAVAGLAAAL